MHNVIDEGHPQLKSFNEIYNTIELSFKINCARNLAECLTRLLPNNQRFYQNTTNVVGHLSYKKNHPYTNDLIYCPSTYNEKADAIDNQSSQYAVYVFTLIAGTIMGVAATKVFGCLFGKKTPNQKLTNYKNQTDKLLTQQQS
jgi:hypothetical protein